MKKLVFSLFFILSIGLLLAACAPADSADCTNLPSDGPKIKIDGAWSRAVVDSSGTSAAYLVINNCGSQPDALIKAASNVAGMAEVHVTQTQNGITMMSQANRIEIPAGKKVELKEGGTHVMLMKLNQAINPGDPVEITLTFEKAGEIKVTAPARAP